MRARPALTAAGAQLQCGAAMSFILDWFWNVLGMLGLANKNAKIVFLGLDNAGKTTLLYKLRSNAVNQYIPTVRAQVEEIVRGVDCSFGSGGGGGGGGGGGNVDDDVEQRWDDDDDSGR